MVVSPDFAGCFDRPGLLSRRTVRFPLPDSSSPRNFTPVCRHFEALAFLKSDSIVCRFWSNPRTPAASCSATRKTTARCGPTSMSSLLWPSANTSSKTPHSSPWARPGCWQLTAPRHPVGRPDRQAQRLCRRRQAGRILVGRLRQPLCIIIEIQVLGLELCGTPPRPCRACRRTLHPTHRTSVTWMMWKPNSVRTGSLNSSLARAKAASSKAGTIRPRSTQPRSPPLFAEPGSSGLALPSWQNRHRHAAVRADHWPCPEPWPRHLRPHLGATVTRICRIARSSRATNSARWSGNTAVTPRR